MLFGLYLISPFYVAVPGSAIAGAFANYEVQRITIGIIFYVLPSLPIILGFFNEFFRTNKWYAFANNYMFVGLLFLTLLRLLTVGFVPFTWIFSLGLGLVSGVCSLYWRRNA